MTKQTELFTEINAGNGSTTTTLTYLPGRGVPPTPVPVVGRITFATLDQPTKGRWVALSNEVRQNSGEDVKKTQSERILAHLKDDLSITPLEALELYGCFRLGARIYDLRKQGYKIRDVLIEENGKRFSRYWMEKSVSEKQVQISDIKGKESDK